MSGLELSKGSQRVPDVPKVISAFLLTCDFSPMQQAWEQKREKDDSHSEGNEAIEPGELDSKRC